MIERGTAGRGCEGKVTGRKIDFLGYQFTREKTFLRKNIKQTFARKAKKIKNKKRRQEVLASYYGWCKWGNCRNLWNKLTNNDMSFGQRGLKSQNKTKDGKRFFDVAEKKMMEILNSPITVTDFETGICTKNGNDRYAILFKMLEYGEWKSYKVITNSFTLKNILDQARSYDKRLNELREMVESSKQKYGSSFDISRLSISDEDREILNANTPIFPQETSIHRRDLGGGKYDFYFE